MSEIPASVSGTAGQIVRLFGRSSLLAVNSRTVAAGIEVAFLARMRRLKPPSFSPPLRSRALGLLIGLGLVLCLLEGLACTSSTKVHASKLATHSAPVAFAIDLPANFNHCRTPNAGSTDASFVIGTHGLEKLTNFIESSDPSSKLFPSQARSLASYEPLDARARIEAAQAVCVDAALDLALHALPHDHSNASPFASARAREHKDVIGCNMRCWFNRETAVVALLESSERRWPRPSEIDVEQLTQSSSSWLFFLSSPDLSDAWTWISVPKRALPDGTVRVRVWSER